MKITHTLVKEDGLYGMVMPEKPQFNCTNYITGPCTVHSVCRCHNAQVRYDDVIKESKEAAIRYEDQRMILSYLPDEAFRRTEKDETEVIQSIYPLPEPLDFDEVLQYLNETENEWMDIPKSVGAIEPYIKTQKVLRISQGADNRAYVKKVVQERERLKQDLGVEEKTRKAEYGLDYFGPVHDCTDHAKINCKCPEGICEYPNWHPNLEVEEKKEPEYILDGVSVFPDRAEMTEDTKTRLTLLVATCNPSIKKIETYAGRPIKIVGFSEREEPTQEQLWGDALVIIESLVTPPDSYGRYKTLVKHLSEQFTITRRA